MRATAQHRPSCTQAHIVTPAECKPNAMVFQRELYGRGDETVAPLIY